jgi:hypothetical protein
MLVHESTSTFGVVRRDGGVQLAVGFARRLGHVGLFRMQRVKGLLDQRPSGAEHGQQGLVVRGNHQCGVEIQARGSRVVAVWRLDRALDGRFERGQIFVGRAQRGELSSGGFQRLARLSQLLERRAAQMQVSTDRIAEQRNVRLRDIRPTLTADLDSYQTVGLQCTQGIPNGDAADRELLGHLALGRQSVARPVLAGQDRSTDLGDHIAGRPRWPDWREDRGVVALHGPNSIPWSNSPP